ncbi:MAG: nucleotide sugar dehydrogenase [Candidatus Peribacteraceae bacterium]
MKKEPIICVIGLGYVGLPLAAAFGRTGWKTYGFDINAERIRTLLAGHDWTHELTEDDLKKTKIEYSNEGTVISQANTIIVAVPTPVDSQNEPDLTPVIKASETVGKHLSKGSVVVYESTVYPGVTEEICVPILEKQSGLKCGTDFTVGYSPERINPGDKEHTIDKIVKVVAGQDTETADWLVMVYGKIVTAGIHKAPNIKSAELAKAIENTQRDLNIGLINEIAMFCDKLGIRTKDVLEAAGTKWNFLRFQPGLVGGHCIGVDPYYLVTKARMLGMSTEIISAGRKINDSMGAFVAGQIDGAMGKKGKVLILGLTFKENIPDTRNSKVIDVINSLQSMGHDVFAHDPWHDQAAIEKMGLAFGSLETGPFDCIAVLVPHAEYRSLGVKEFVGALQPGGVFYDLKSIWKHEEAAKLGFTYRSL